MTKNKSETIQQPKKVDTRGKTTGVVEPTPKRSTRGEIEARRDGHSVAERVSGHFKQSLKKK